MPVREIIETRRAYRSLEPVEITTELINDLATAAQLAPSCYNNQPWRYVFVHDPDVLTQMHEALTRGNAWAKAASMIIVVFSKKDHDCIIHDREYFLFDTGLATAFLILRATELGLVAHPIAGYSPKKVREILNIPDDMAVIALVIIGTHASTLNPVLSEKQQKDETTRPTRLPLNDFIYHNKVEL